MASVIHGSSRDIGAGVARCFVRSISESGRKGKASWARARRTRWGMQRKQHGTTGGDDTDETGAEH